MDRNAESNQSKIKYHKDRHPESHYKNQTRTEARTITVRVIIWKHKSLIVNVVYLHVFCNTIDVICVEISPVSSMPGLGTSR